MPYMVTNGQTGFLIAPESCEQIADRLVRLLNDQGLGRGMGQCAREEARARWHPETVAKKTVAVYHQMLSGK